MSFRINCELCGTWISAERRSKQYCAPCRPKAVVLNNVVKALNFAAEVEGPGIDDLVEQRVDIDYHSILRGSFEFLSGTQPLGALALLNIALKDYGMVAWDGTRFEIVQWRDQPGVVLTPDPGETPETEDPLTDIIRRRVAGLRDHSSLPLDRGRVNIVPVNIVPAPRGPAPRDGYGRYRDRR